MNEQKIKRANELYSKIQGALWAKDKCHEYGHYDNCENISKTIDQWHKELDELKLTDEEKQKTGYEFIDHDLADEWYWRLRA